MIWSGIETTDRTNEIRMMIATTVLLTHPFRCSPRYLGSFMRKRNGTIASGSVAAVSAMDTMVTFMGSTPNSSGIAARKMMIV